ncbi:MAG TPA: hypothetical protein VFI33_15110, partial [Puia sp.]|nr:hypothetical protein [Puia sp.]
MKIFTLLQNLLKMITGQTSRNLPFISATRNAQGVKPNQDLHSIESTPIESAPVQLEMIPAKKESVSFEYKLTPVQKKKTSVQTIKPVVMQNFFAIVKKIFSLSDHPKTLLENLNDGYHPGCSYGTAGPENISRINQNHDVANPAASFAFIPVPLTPTAMSHLEKKPVKTVTGRSGIFGIIMLMSMLFFVSTAMAQRIASASGNWSSTTTWGGQAPPTAAQTVTINSNITVTV